MGVSLPGMGKRFARIDVRVVQLTCKIDCPHQSPDSLPEDSVREDSLVCGHVLPKARLRRLMTTYNDLTTPGPKICNFVPLGVLESWICRRNRGTKVEA
eukprot:3240951-Rhodomonas_salina.4